MNSAALRKLIRILLPEPLLNYKKIWTYKRSLKRYGFDIRVSDKNIKLYKDGIEVYCKEGNNSIRTDNFVMAIVHTWKRLQEKGFKVSLAENTATLTKNRKEVHIRDIDKQPWIEDYLNGIINHWDSIKVTKDGEIYSFAGVGIDGRSASFVYKGEDVEYEISEQWMIHDLEEVLFFPDLFPNYLNNLEIKPGSTVFDLGSYHGLFALAAAIDVGPKGKVYCFEPDRENCEVIRRNLKRNKLTNVEIVPMIMSGESGPREFIAGYFFNSRIPQGPGDKKYSTVTIESTTLRDYCAMISIKKPDFVKADIEGAELELIEGNRDWIADNDIVFSIASYHIVDGKPTWVRLEKIFGELGYVAWTTPMGTHRTTIAKKN